MKRSELRSLIAEGSIQGGAIGYLAGVLADLLLSKKDIAPKYKSKSPAELKKEIQAKLDKRYKEDPKFKALVDAIKAGNKVV